MAKLAAGRICERHPDRDQQILRAFEEILGRAPTVDELNEVSTFLAGMEDDGMTQLCLSLLNCNEFVFID
jgi:hypothetical protein